ncbi:MAG: DNA mismatch repair protein MutS [Caldimicrobium sp.]|nr:DNA mismatch repair protein MutS [Caldimicrobium sp.]MCX7873214.1 DNA mismatch repair protein MutS [Caldimicrobium sp.]MDW8093901.1 DNA mismatch repair protein MutS [Caldimicrobium sp.]
MFRQYFEIKQKYSDCILFFRLGDFYEMFFEDAERVAPLLGLVLTKREAGKDLTAPMCGVPIEKGDFYVQKLLDLGFKVAICEQVEDPSVAKGLVKREVVRVCTPGLFIDLSYLKEKEKNYLASLVIGKKAGLAFLELSCEELLYTELPIERAITEIIKREPRELLIERDLAEKEVLKELKESLPRIHITPLEEGYFHRSKALFEELSVSEEAQRALSSVIEYLKTLQPLLADRPYQPKFYYPEDSLYIDDSAQRNLELIRNLWDGSTKYSLYWVLDKTQTPMGSRQLKEWILYPLKNQETIRERQRVIEFFLERRSLRETLRTVLSKISDLERLTGRVSLRLINPRELALLRDTLKYLPEIKGLLEREREALDFPLLLKELLQKISTFENLWTLLQRALAENPPTQLKEGGIIKGGYNAILDELKNLRENTITFLTELEQKLKLKTGIPTLKIGYNRVFGYYVEVSKSYVKAVPSYFERKQTLTGGERFTLPELKELEDKILSSENKIKELEYQLFLELREEVLKEVPQLRDTAKALAQLDVLLALAEVAEENHYTKPEVVEEKVLEIEEGRHPVLEKIQGRERFIPNSISLKERERDFIILTGPNMGGKSTFLRQVALIVILAHMGSFVPANFAKVGLFDRIFTRIGAGDELIRGKSTFMVEMSECSKILQQATSNSLVILDEVGRGTSTFDGLSLAWAIAEYLYKKGVFTLLATHYFELTELAKSYPSIKNFHVEVKEWQGEVIFLYRVLPGPAHQSYGIEVAKLAKIPAEVLKRAQEILRDLEKRRPKISQRQLSLFQEDDKSHILDRIRNIDLDRLTPIDALNLLYELKGALKQEKNSKT